MLLFSTILISNLLAMDVTGLTNSSKTTKKNFIKEYTFQNFTVIEKDTGEVRADEIKIRHNNGNVISLAEFHGYFIGIANNDIAIRSADYFGQTAGISFYSSTNGLKIFETDYNYKKKLIIKKKSLFYYRALYPECSIFTDSQCWEKIIKENNIVNKKMPDCKISENLKGNYRAIQLYVPVRIKDYHAPKYEYQTGSAICNESP